MVYNLGQYNHLIHRTLRDLGVESKLISNETPLEEIDADGLVIGGGPSIEKSGRSLEYVKLEIPILGVCLGHHIITVAFGGEVEEQKKAFHDLTLLLILGIILVYMVMASLFGNLRDPLIIMFSVPFAFSGVIYAFYFTGVTLGLMSFMGVVMLMGIVVNNAIVRAEVWNPLGITMLGGLSVSTLITLVLIPTVYYLFEQGKVKRGINP